jgi:glycosyltransferase involved in cell wall biosynthesis
VAKVVFYCNDSLENLNIFEYYKQDIDALSALGHEVIVVNRYRDIPWSFDLLFVWWWTYALLPVVLAKLLNKPSVITGTFNFKFPPGFDGIDYFARPLWKRLVITMAVKFASMNIFVNKSEKKECEEYFRIKTARFLSHVISEDYLKGPSEERILALFNIAWSEKVNLIRKGVPDILEAVAWIKKDFPDLKLFLAGLAGDGEQFLINLIKNLGIEDNVVLLGPLDRETKIAFLRKCEVYVQPSRFEGFGLAIAEAMGSGACIVTCAVGAVPEVVGDTGIYVQPGSSSELAKALTEILRDKVKRSEFQQKTYARALKEFAFSSKVVLMKEFLNELQIDS